MFRIKENEHESYSSKIFYCAVDNKCKSFQLVDGVFSTNDYLDGNRDEGSNRNAFHPCHINGILASPFYEGLILTWQW